MTRDELLDLYRRSGALLEGHFRLTSGLHSPGYLQCALVLQHPRHAEAIGRAIADRVRDVRATVVLSPALGGVVIGQEVGRALGVRAIFAERQEGKLALRRGFTIATTDRVLVVEDVMTTGGSTRETIDVAKAAGGQVVGAAAIVDRSPSALREPQGRPEQGRGAAGSGQAGTERFDVPFIALLEIALPTYEPDTCPLCAQGLPVVKPGSRPVVA
jgi:orotate phosphoribosyltransferase